MYREYSRLDLRGSGAKMPHAVAEAGGEGRTELERARQDVFRQLALTLSLSRRERGLFVPEARGMIGVDQRPNQQGLYALAAVALDMIRDGFVVGLGSGHAVTAFVQALGTRVRDGLRIRGVPTSRDTARMALRLGIPLVPLDDIEAIDVTIDGADEVDPHLDLIKGLGGALVREKIVASVSRRLVILAGVEKLVSVLGEHGVLPVEIVPFGLSLCRRRVTGLGLQPVPREVGGKLFVTDNGNYVLDCNLAVPPDPVALEQSLRAIPGVVGTGFFLGMADTVLVQDGDRVDVRQRPPS